MLFTFHGTQLKLAGPHDLLAVSSKVNTFSFIPAMTAVLHWSSVFQRTSFVYVKQLSLTISSPLKHTKTIAVNIVVSLVCVVL